MTEPATWRLQRQTVQLRAVRSKVAGLWKDSAGKHVESRYLRPHDSNATQMVASLEEQEAGLAEAGQCRIRAGEHEAVAVRHAEVVEDELHRSTQEISTIYDFVQLAIGFQNRASVAQQRSDELTNRASTPCGGIVAESGVTVPSALLNAIQPSSLDYRMTSSGGINLDPEDGPCRIAEDLPPLPGYTDVIIHGDEDGTAFMRDQGEVSPKLIAQTLDEAGVEGPLRLLACNAGAHEDGPAQQLADESQQEILAATNSVWPETGTVESRPGAKDGVWRIVTPRSL